MLWQIEHNKIHNYKLYAGEAASGLLVFNIFISSFQSSRESRQSAALSSAIQHALLPEFCGKLETECLNTRFLLPTLLFAGYSMKLKINIHT